MIATGTIDPFDASAHFSQVIGDRVGDEGARAQEVRFPGIVPDERAVGFYEIRIQSQSDRFLGA